MESTRAPHLISNSASWNGGAHLSSATTHSLAMKGRGFLYGKPIL
jgi:hypothetical protein